MRSATCLTRCCKASLHRSEPARTLGRWRYSAETRVIVADVAVAGLASHRVLLPCLPPGVGVAMGDAVSAALAAALSGADAETREYAAGVAAGVLEDAPPGAAAAATSAELVEALGPILEDAGLSSDDVAALCDRLAAAHLGAAPDAGAAPAGADLLIDLRGIILAFAGKARPSRGAARAPDR